jgi:hypothetical protein
MAAELEADQVVLLEAAERSAQPVLAQLPHLQLVRVRRRRADRPRPAAHADRVADRRLRDGRVERARRARPVRTDSRRLAAMRAARDREKEHGEHGEREGDVHERETHSIDGTNAPAARKGASHIRHTLVTNGGRARV